MTSDRSKREIERAELSTLRVLTGFDRGAQVVLSVAIVAADALFIVGVEKYLDPAVFKERYCGASVVGSLCLVFLSAL